MSEKKTLQEKPPTNVHAVRSVSGPIFAIMTDKFWTNFLNVFLAFLSPRGVDVLLIFEQKKHFDKQVLDHDDLFFGPKIGPEPDCKNGPEIVKHGLVSLKP